MDPIVEAQRLHRIHCGGCSDCRFRDALPGPAGVSDMDAFCPCGCTDHLCWHSGFYVCETCPPGCHGTSTEVDRWADDGGPVDE